MESKFKIKQNLFLECLTYLLYVQVCDFDV